MEDNVSEATNLILEKLFSMSSLIEMGLIFVALISAWFFSTKIIAPFMTAKNDSADKLSFYKVGAGKLLFSFLLLIFIWIAIGLSHLFISEIWLLRMALYIICVAFFFRATKVLVLTEPAQTIVKLVGLSIISLYFFQMTSEVVKTLDSVAFELGEFRLSVYGLLRILLFGLLLFWLGRLSNKAGQVFIRKQNQLDFRTRELLAKLFELSLFFVGLLLLLQVVGINLTALAVFGGALGIGLGIGLQAIASNFISGLIILIDRSVSLGDYIELEDGRTGTVTQQNLRSTTLETFDARNIVVPNETFITTSFTNWTHKNAKQRYRVDFSVSYSTDVRSMVELVKEAVAEHPSVLSGNDLPIEERPDCEIDSFGDSGINMFVEFWMEGIDDGRNRVGGDLLLIILETLQRNGIEIPFPQREVRILNEGQVDSAAGSSD